MFLGQKKRPKLPVLPLHVESPIPLSHTSNLPVLSPSPSPSALLPLARCVQTLESIPSLHDAQPAGKDLQCHAGEIGDDDPVPDPECRATARAVTPRKQREGGREGG